MRNLKPGGVSNRLERSVKSFLWHLFDQEKSHTKQASMLDKLPKILLKHLRFERLEHYVRKLTFIPSLPPKAPFYICDICDILDLPAGAYLCCEGRLAEACWILISGRLAKKGS